MKPEDIKKAPKLFCESINVAFTPEYFVMSLSSGEESEVFTLTPQHTKRLKQYLEYQMTEYEKVHGEVKTQWTPNIVSPVQPTKKSTN